jgi:broad specificity phosphatase PhoE
MNRDKWDAMNDGPYTAWLSWFHLIEIYLVVTWRFLRWRLRLWRHPSLLGESSQISMKRTLLIIRHGQTTWNAEHRLPGQLPGVVLNDTGKQQAARLAEALTVLPISAVISSPLERARETAEYIARGRDLQIQFEPGLMDTNVGPWAGQAISELSKNNPDWTAYVRNPTVAPEGVETFPQVQQRVVTAVERWCERDNIGAYPAFVAHADVIKLLIAHYTGLPTERAGSISIDNASVSIVELEKDRSPHVLSIGWSPHPGWLKPPILERAEKAEKEEEQEKGQPVQEEAEQVGEQKT